MSCIKNITPIKSIRLYCIEICMEGQMTEVRLCHSVGCDLWLYRMGRRPSLVELVEWFQFRHYKSVIKSGNELRRLINTPVKAIRKKCLNCSGWGFKEVKQCAEDECHIYGYRMGRRPKRAIEHDLENKDQNEGNK